MKKGIVVALAVGLAAGLLATGAVAGKGDYVRSKLTLENIDPGIYEGSLEAKEAACEKGRTVRVFHDQNRNGIDKTDYFIGKDLTDKRGEYEVDGSQAPAGDRIVAEVKKRKLDDGTLCGTGKAKASALGG